MPVHLSLEYQDYSDPMFDFVSEPKNMALIGLSVGYPIDAGRFATVARQQKNKKIHDVFPLPGVNAVSERFKEIVESYEPGVHQFFPVELFDKAGDRVPTNYYIFNCTVCVDAVLVEHSEVRWSQRRVEPYDPFPRIDHSSDTAAAVDFHGHAGDHRRFIGTEEAGGVAHILGRRKPADGIVERNLARISGVSSPMKDLSSGVSPATGLMALTLTPAAPVPPPSSWSP
jgi:hypothetical protein